MPLAFAVVLVATSTASAGSDSAPGKSVPVAASPPSISGATIQGQSLSSSSGSWDGPSSTYTYQWVRCSSAGTSCSPIGAATAQAYALAATDVGSTLRVVVTASNKNGSAVGTSDATAIVAAAAPPAPTPSSSTTSTTTASATTSSTTTSSTTTTTTPTTTTTAVPTQLGVVTSRGDFETGNLSQWDQVQCLNYGYGSNTEFTRGNAFAVSDIFSKGLYSARIDLPAAANKSACELQKGPFPSDIANDTWYSLEVRFPTNWVEPGGWGGTINQLHFQWPMIWAGPVQMVAHADRVEVALQSGRCGFGTGCSTNLKPVAVPSGQLTLGTWHQFIVHAHWATDNSGVLEVWWRRRGETTWNKTISLTGVPTMQTDLSGNLVSTEVYDKIGFYRGPSSVPLSIWHDNFCRATSFAAASSCVG
jgi:fibronectin type 3 domain-containing protein